MRLLWALTLLPQIICLAVDGISDPHSHLLYAFGISILITFCAMTHCPGTNFYKSSDSSLMLAAALLMYCGRDVANHSCDGWSVGKSLRETATLFFKSNLIMLYLHLQTVHCCIWYYGHVIKALFMEMDIKVMVVLFSIPHLFWCPRS